MDKYDKYKEKRFDILKPHQVDRSAGDGLCLPGRKTEVQVIFPEFTRLPLTGLPDFGSW